MQRRFALLALTGSALGWLPLSAWAQTEGLRELETFLSGVQQGRAAFTQTVTAPLRDGEAVARLMPGDAFDLLDVAGGRAWGIVVATGLVGYVDAAVLEIEE